MAGNFDFSVIISQVPHVQKMQGDIQKGPFNLQEGLQREIDKKQDKVPKEIEESAKGGKFQKVGDDRQRKGSQSKERQKKEKREKEKDKKAHKLTDSTIGRILDIKV
ncbi:hypothetical protein JCM12298_10320 [Desulfothermus naphthae]